MPLVSEHYGSMRFPVELNVLYNKMSPRSDNHNRLTRHLECSPDERASKVRRYLQRTFLNPELNTCITEDQKVEVERRFHKAIAQFQRERKLARDLYTFISRGDRESFYTAIELFLGKEIFPRKNGRHDLASCRTIWAEYGNRAYEYLLGIIDQVDPGRQTLTMTAEFSGMEPEVLLSKLWRGDDRKSHEAIVLLRLMLLEAQINTQVADMEPGAGYGGYFSKEIAGLTRHLVDEEKLFTEQSGDCACEIYFDKTNSLRAQAYVYRNTETGEGEGVIMESEKGDYVRDYEYDIRPPIIQAKEKIAESLNHVGRHLKTFALQGGNAQLKGETQSEHEIEKKGKQLKHSLVIKDKYTVRFIRFDGKDGVTFEYLPVIWDTRLKPEASLKSKLIRKDQESIDMVGDVSGGKFVFFTMDDALKALPKILEALPPSLYGALFRNTLFQREDIDRTLSGDQLAVLTSEIGSPTPQSDGNLRIFKYNTHFNGHETEIQVSIFPYYINEHLSIGEENHEWYRLRQYLETIVPLFFPYEVEGSYQKSWRVISRALYEAYVSSRRGKRAMKKRNSALEVIERDFVPHLASVIRERQYAFLKEGGEIPKQLFSAPAQKILLEAYGDDREIQRAIEEFRAAVQYHRKKLVTVNARLHGACSEWGQDDERAAVEIVKARTQAIVEMLLMSFCKWFADNNSE